MTQWREKVLLGDVFDDDDMPFPERRDTIVARLRASRWFGEYDEWSELHEIIDNLADAENVDQFDDWWDRLYDEADTDRVWVDIWTSP